MTKQRSARELEQQQKNLEYTGEKLKVFVADILPRECCTRENMEDRMLEMENLVNTYGGVVILKHLQKRGLPDYKTYIGSGKLDEIIDEMELQGANLLILGNILKPHQIYNINERLRKIGAKAWDRVDLILKIFERNAKSTESRLQIELAAIKHMGPRIFGMGMELSKQGAGVGTRGKGETNTEIMKRHLRKKEQGIRKELEHYAKVRAEHRKGRLRKGLNTVGVVGYTNAGKSTLTNALTKKGVLAEDKLFATLGTSVGKMWVSPPPNPLPSKEGGEGAISPLTRGRLRGGFEVLINDTIGFIRDLPPDLVDAFSSTLEDSIESQILLHVVDATDPKIEEKIKVVDDILESIGANQKKTYVFNKIDELTSPLTPLLIGEGDNQKEFDNKLDYLKEKFAYLNPVFISAYKNINLDELKERIVSELEK